MPSLPIITCAYCRHAFVGVRVARHGLLRRGKCGSTFCIRRRARVGPF